MPTQPENITLPAIEVPWFDVTTGQTKLASVPSRSIVAVGDASTHQTPPSVSSSQPEPVPQPVPTQSPTSSLLWIIIVGAAAFLLGLGAAVLIFRHKEKIPEEKKKKKPLPDLYPF